MTTQLQTGHRCDIVEFRQYELLPGRRDELIELFDREFVEPQEQLGIHVIGQFRDVDRPTRFTWLRGFASMPSRRAALTGFYLDGAAWAEHGPAANATMVDSDNVLLLRPVPDAPRLCAHTGPRAAAGGRPTTDAVVTVTVHHLDADTDAATLWPQAVGGNAAGVVGVLQSEHGENTFPQLPVIADADVLLVVRHFASDAERLDAVADVAALPGIRTEEYVLRPTPRSALY